MLENIESVFRVFDESIRASSGERTRLVGARDRAADALAGDSRVLRVIDGGSYRHGTEVGGASWFDAFVVLAGKPVGAAKAAEVVASALGGGASGATAVATGAAATVAAGDSGWPGIRITSTGVYLAVEGGGREDGSGARGDEAGAGARGDEAGAGAEGARAGGDAGGDAVVPGIRLMPAFEAPSGVSAAGGDVVLVADATKRWVATRVGARETLLNRVDDAGLRPLIRLVLAWKHRVQAEVSSYYLETAVIRQALQQPSFSVLWDLCWTFEQLAADDLMTLTDVSSPSPKQGVRATASLAKRIETGYLVSAAATHLRAAVNASIDDDDETVSARLRAVFGSGFAEL